ncbi:MAG: methyl-accepting chemotaxis protein [Planctomycetota bacterium]
MQGGVPFHRSIVGRSILLGVLPAALVVLAIVAVNGVRAWTKLAGAVEEELRQVTELAVREIELGNASNAALARMMADAQESGQFGRRAETLRMMERVVRSNPRVYAASVAYEPNADGNDAAPGVPAEALGDAGRFYAYFKRDPKSSTGFVLEPLQSVDADGDLWYGLPRERYNRAGAREVVITKPYEYLGTDIIEVVSPIVVDGRFVGIAGVDVSLADLQRRIGDLAERLEADIFLETRGLFVAATSDGAAGTALRTKPVEGTALAEAFARVPREGLLFDMAMASDLGEECYFAGATTATGGWRLLVRKPTASVLAEVRGTLLANLATACVGIAIIVAMLVAGALAVGRRVRAAQESAARIASGDLSSPPAEARGSDETAELLRAMGRMNGDLARIVDAVRTASTQLAATSAQLAATSREQAAGTATFGESTQQIAAAVREISATGTELARSIEDIDAGARRTAAAALGGRSGLEGMAVSMEGLSRISDEVARRLRTITEKAESITTVVTTITKVAEQTNLLSVNAAIEAEKAGDAGFGFLVVAREIRRLADQTAAATTDIDRIVRQMQEAVAAGAGEMQRFSSEVRVRTAEAQSIAAGIGGIIGDMDRSASAFTEVRGGMSGQATGLAQIEDAVVRVAAGAREAATGAAETGRVADELAHAVAVLQDAVARFRTAARGQDGAP